MPATAHLKSGGSKGSDVMSYIWTHQRDFSSPKAAGEQRGGHTEAQRHQNRTERINK